MRCTCSAGTGGLPDTVTSGEAADAADAAGARSARSRRYRGRARAGRDRLRAPDRRPASELPLPSRAEQITRFQNTGWRLRRSRQHCVRSTRAGGCGAAAALSVKARRVEDSSSEQRRRLRPRSEVTQIGASPSSSILNAYLPPAPDADLAATIKRAGARQRGSPKREARSSTRKLARRRSLVRPCS